MLELAAKAAGILTSSWYGNEYYIDGMLSRWNPLEDDGDALRLAVALGLIVDVNLNEHVTTVDYTTPLGEDECALEGHWPDRHAATRRAITRAAAAIGRAMP